MAVCQARTNPSMNTSEESPSKGQRNRGKGNKASTGSSSRTLTLEKAYVHDVYSWIASKGDPASSPVHSHVKHFLTNEFEPGSLLLDVGCGDGKYLNFSPEVVVFGLEHCVEWFSN